MGKRGSSTETKMHIAMTLKEMLTNLPLARVKVSSLCKQAEVSRTTFYDYFQDVFAVATWLWDHLVSESLYQMGLSINHFDAHVKTFYSLLEYRDFFLHVFKSKDVNSVFEHGSRVVKKYMIENASKNAGRTFTDFEMLQIEFRNAGAAHTTKVWVLNGMNEPPEEMARLFQGFTPQFLIDYLEVPSKTRPYNPVSCPT